MASPELPLQASPSRLPRTLTDRIPGELHDRIIDHLHADPSTLAVCSTVCRAWLHASRHHLISTLEIRRHNALVHRILLDAPHATLGTSVRHLALRASQTVQPKHFLGTPLPAVESLLLSASYLIPVNELLSWARCYTHQLVELVLYSIKLDSFAEFTTMLHQFKVLRHLSLANGVTWVDPGLPSVAKVNNSPKVVLLTSLRSLILYGNSTVDFLLWLLARGVVSIARLDVRLSPSWRFNASDAPQRLVEIGQAYHALGSSLHELDLYDGYQSTIDLSANTNLRALWFHDVVLSLGGWVVDLLAQVTSPHLHTITLHVYSDDHGERVSLEMFDWLAFTRLLSSAPFSAQLKTIRILWLGFYEDAELTTGVYKRLIGHVPDAVECVVADFVPETKRRFGATTHGRVFDRHYNQHM